MIWIGIDPGEHTGLAVWDTDRNELVAVMTVPIHRAMDAVRMWRDDSEALTVVFEDARQRKWFEREKDNAEYRGKLMGAGAAKRDARIWEEFLEDSDIACLKVPPRPGMTKWNADTFARVTGWKGRTSNHARDAAMLVWGR